MTREEKLRKTGSVIIWECDDELFFAQDGGDFWFLNFYKNNDDTPMVDEFYIDDEDKFDPEKFDFINGVPDYMETEDEFWTRIVK